MGQHAATHERNTALSVALRRGIHSSSSPSWREADQLSILNRSRYTLLQPLAEQREPTDDEVESILTHCFADAGLETAAPLVIQQALGRHPILQKYYELFQEMCFLEMDSAPIRFHVAAQMRDFYEVIIYGSAHGGWQMLFS